jgi:two-component system sensor kinase FixL
MAGPSHADDSASPWRAIVQSAVDGIIVIDQAGRIEAFNPAAERLFGYHEREVLGKNIAMLMPSPHSERHDMYLRSYLTTGVAKVIGRGREVIGLRRDGTTFPAHLTVGEAIVGGQRKFTGIVHDLSERVRMEERLREQTALARLGEMAAVVAHEVKNPLAAIRAAVQTLGTRVPPGPGSDGVVQQIVSRIDALSNLMQDLLLFARPPRPRSTPVAVAALLESTAEFLKHHPALADVTIEIAGEGPPIDGDPELLKIVFLNIMVNSGEAMHDGGRIDVRIGRQDGWCVIDFLDTGPGIPPPVREMVFTPFFTTKARGTGLGLVTAKRLVEAHGGTIALECPQAGGTRVTVHLPARCAQADAIPSSASVDKQ